MNKNLTPIKLPKFSTFRGTSIDTSPYEMFHFWVAAQVGGKTKGKKISVSGSWLHPEDAARLDKAELAWIRKHHKELGSEWAKQALVWRRLDLSPANWLEGKVPEGVKPGVVYVNKSKLFEG